MHKSTSRIVGENVRRLRGDMSQTELGLRLAGELGKDQVNQSTVYRLEEGKRPTTVDELAALARIFNVDPRVLLSETVDETAAVSEIFELARLVHVADEKLRDTAMDRDQIQGLLRARLASIDPAVFSPLQYQSLERLAESSAADQLLSDREIAMLRAEAEADRLTD